MFITVKFGENESLLCNPSCAVVNLLNSIRRRAGYANTNVCLDLSDETGLVKELDAHRHDYATKYLASHGTYILVKKLAAVAASVAVSTSDELESERGSQATYVPLLSNYSEHFPNYRVHVHNIEKRLKPRSQHSKSPSPAGFRGTKSSRAKPPNSRASNRRK